MPSMDPAIDEFREAISRRDCDAVRLALHPYVHWTQPDGTVIQGRKNVLAMLTQTHDRPAPPTRAQLRDGQIYRWVC